MIQFGYVGPYSVRADFGINKGDIVSWELDVYITHNTCNFMGVATSQIMNYNSRPSKGMKHAYGIEDGRYTVYNGNGKEERIAFKKPEFPTKQVFNVKMTMQIVMLLQR